MTLALFLHRPTQARYIVLLADGAVLHAAGPLSSDDLHAAQIDEWGIPWMPGLAAWIEARRGEFVELHPKMRERR